MHFRYRDSIFQHQLLIILEVAFELKRRDREQINKLISIMQEMRARKGTMPKRYLGCTFCPCEPSYVHAGRRRTANWLIERIQLGNLTEGGIFVHPKLPNCLFNDGNGTTEQFIRLARKIYLEVYDKFKVKLRLEIKSFPSNFATTAIVGKLEDDDPDSINSSPVVGVTRHKLRVTRQENSNVKRETCSVKRENASSPVVAQGGTGTSSNFGQVQAQNRKRYEHKLADGANESAACSEQVSPNGRARRTASPLILIVENEDEWLTKYETWLINWDYKYIVTVKSAKEAWDIFSKQPDKFSLVITDLDMEDLPGKGLKAGEWLIEEIRKLNPKAKILAITGNNHTANFEKGPDHVFYKYELKADLLKEVMAKSFGINPDVFSPVSFFERKFSILSSVMAAFLFVCAGGCATTPKSKDIKEFHSGHNDPRVIFNVVPQIFPNLSMPQLNKMLTQQDMSKWKYFPTHGSWPGKYDFNSIAPPDYWKQQQFNQPKFKQAPAPNELFKMKSPIGNYQQPKQYQPLKQYLPPVYKPAPAYKPYNPPAYKPYKSYTPPAYKPYTPPAYKPYKYTPPLKWK